MVGKTRSEDTLIFNALTPDITNMETVYQAIEEFCNIKKKADPSERFNIILFQEDGPNYLEDFTLNPENILIALKSLEPILVKANVAGGIFVALTFIIQVFKKISEKCFRLIILTDSGSLKIPKSYIPALQDLIDSVHTFPTDRRPLCPLLLGAYHNTLGVNVLHTRLRGVAGGGVAGLAKTGSLPIFAA